VEEEEEINLITKSEFQMTNTSPIDVKTKITVNVKETKGFGKSFPELKKEIKEAITRD
jgi:hypothetical protein